MHTTLYGALAIDSRDSNIYPKKANAQLHYMNPIMCLLLIQNEGGQQNIKFRSVDRFQPW